MTNAIHRTPCLETAQIKMLLNGPESFTLDGNFILGEAPEVARLFRVRGIQLGGHRQLRRRRPARRRVDRRRRSADRPVGRRHPPLRAVSRQPPASRRSHGRIARPALRDALAARGAATVRPLRRSPLYDRLRAKGAVFGTKLNWERANYFLPPGASPRRTRSTRPAWLPYVLDEQRACREDVVVFDQTSFSKFVLKGRDALAVLQRLCANEIDVPIGRMVYTAMLNARGGFESDLTITRLAPDTFFILTGSGQATRDASWIERHIGEGEFAALVDVTSAYSVISLMGPKSEALLRTLGPDDLSKAGLPFSMTAEIDVGHARVRAARMSYVGGPGYEMVVPDRPMRDALRRARRARARRSD